MKKKLFLSLVLSSTLFFTIYNNSKSEAYNKVLSESKNSSSNEKNKNELIANANINDKKKSSKNTLITEKEKKEAKAKLIYIEKKFENTKKAFKDVDYINAKNYINLATKEAKNLKDKNSLNIFNNNIKLADLSLMYSRNIETRGLYLDTDTIPTTKKEIEELIIKIKKANFNVIYPEVFRRGYSIYPNNISDTDDRFKASDFDVLEYIIEVAHKNNLEVYPWFWCFRVKSPLWGDSFLKKYPDLVARREKYNFEDREPLFLSPSEPKARELVTKIVSNVVKNYSVDGVLLDYIRFDETLPDDILTKKYFRDYYFSKYKKEPPKKIIQGDNDFLEFQLWRENQVTESVKSIRKEILAHKPKIKLGVAVFRNEKETRLLKMQDWRYWYNTALIDFVCPMLYTDLPKDLNTWVDTESDDDTRKDFLYPSLGALRFNKNSDLYPLVDLLHERKVTGFNIFSLIHFGTETFEDLSKGVFRKPAIHPDKSINESLDLLNNNILSWLGKINYNNSILSTKVKNLKHKYDKKSFETTITEVKKLNLPPLLLKELLNELEFGLKIIEIYDFRKNSIGKTFKQTVPPFLQSLEEARYTPPAKFFKTTQKAIIDGNLELNFWDRIEPISNFYSFNGTTMTSVETLTKLAYNKDNIYISFENLEPEMVNAQKDSVEVYLNDTDKKIIHHLTFDIHNNKKYEKNNKVFSHKFIKSVVKQLNNKWIVEIQIPIKNLEISDLKNITANFVRTRDTEIIKKNVWYPDYNTKDTNMSFGKTIFVK
ncbi:MAG: family 10 glycosylhydrolase [Candidatus Sericytochromatia bacterium]